MPIIAQAMGRASKIEWTHHTFNPWWGCVKVSPACKHCYAETWARRVGQHVWGRNAARRFFSDKHWKEPLKWNKEAGQDRERRRVFCASMADVFERRAELNPARERLWALIEATPWLDWLLLTKRPQNIAVCLPWADLPRNIWLGATTETQRFFDERIDRLLSINARVHFLSCEPLLGALTLSPAARKHIDWIIAGGESGHHARPMNPAWAKNLRDQCIRADIPFHFKQWGHWSPVEPQSRRARQIILSDSIPMFGVGKGLAGRALDGMVWDQFPQ